MCRGMTVIPADPTAPMRLFVALWPDPVTRAAIAQWQRAWDWPPRAAPVKAERLHLTLHFLGDVPAGRLGEIAAGLRSPFEPFELEFGHGEVWPNGIAVLEPADTPPPTRTAARHAARRRGRTGPCGGYAPVSPACHAFPAGTRRHAARAATALALAGRSRVCAGARARRRCRLRDRAAIRALARRRGCRIESGMTSHLPALPGSTLAPWSSAASRIA